MNSFSPTAHGFRIALRRPSIPLAEIVWRWSFAAGAWVLSWLFFIEYLDSLPVTRGERLLLFTRQPVLISRAIHRIFHGSAVRFIEAGVVLVLCLVIAWIVLASFGRAATVMAVLESFEFAMPAAGNPFRRLVALNFLRSAVALSATAGVAGAMLLASSFWASTRVPAQDASRLFSLVLFLVWLAWAMLNWLLSVSAVVAVSEGRPALRSIADAVDLLLQEPGLMLTTGVLFGLAHLAAFIAASFMGFVIAGGLGVMRISIVVFAGLLLLAAYCATADFLYTARMAAYVVILRREEASSLSSVGQQPVMPGDTSSRIDPDELILSDMPLPAG